MKNATIDIMTNTSTPTLPIRGSNSQMIQLMVVNQMAFMIKMVGMTFSVVFWLDNCPPAKYPTEIPKSVTEIITAQEMVVAPKKEASILGAIISTAKLANPAKKTSEKINEYRTMEKFNKERTAKVTNDTVENHPES